MWHFFLFLWQGLISIIIISVIVVVVIVVDDDVAELLFLSKSSVHK